MQQRFLSKYVGNLVWFYVVKVAVFLQVNFPCKLGKNRTVNFPWQIVVKIAYCFSSKFMRKICFKFRPTKNTCGCGAIFWFAPALICKDTHLSSNCVAILQNFADYTKSRFFSEKIVAKFQFSYFLPKNCLKNVKKVRKNVSFSQKLLTQT